MQKSQTPNRKPKVAVLTQADAFVIPDNIVRLAKSDIVSIAYVVKISSKGAVENKAWLFLQGFGIRQFLKLAMIRLSRFVLELIDILSLRKMTTAYSLHGAALKSKAKFLSVSDPNSSAFLNLILAEEIDLIVSYSAPVIFGPSLLQTPTLGCINLHCSILPKYAGLLPSFWTLYDGNEEIGATVHMMDSKIDNGSILGQVTLTMPDKPSMYKIIKKTKMAGGDLMISTISSMLDGTCISRENNTCAKDYRSWPTLAEIRAFRRLGGRLI